MHSTTFCRCVRPPTLWAWQASLGPAPLRTVMPSKPIKPAWGALSPPFLCIDCAGGAPPMRRCVCHHLPPAQRVCHHLPPAQRVCHHLPPAQRVCHHIPPAQRVCHHIPPAQRVCHHLPPAQRVRHHIPPAQRVCHHFSPAQRVCHHRPLTGCRSGEPRQAVRRGTIVARGVRGWVAGRSYGLPCSPARQGREQAGGPAGICQRHRQGCASGLAATALQRSLHCRWSRAPHGA